MNKSAILIAVLGAMPAFAMAADVTTINFRGEVTDQTCVVSINGNTNAVTVLMPSVKVADLSTAGSTAGQTVFTIDLKDCAAQTEATNIKTYFAGKSLIASTKMGNTAGEGGAKNVFLELYDPESPANPIDLSGMQAFEGMVLAADATSAKRDMGVRYGTEGETEAGSVVGSLQFAIAYK